MFFNSWIFAFFLPIVLSLYYLSGHRKQNAILLIASYVFYGWWDYRFLGLLAGSTLVDFWVGRRMGQTTDSSTRKWLLALSCSVNLGALGFFKYCNFFIDSLSQVMLTMGADASLPVLNIVLPVGISFYTFQTMSYTIDVYRGHMKPATNIIDFALYVSFFPQLVAGPIERAVSLMPQVMSPRRPNRDDLAIGLWMMLQGFFKKMVIADNLAPLVNQIYSSTSGQQSGAEIWLATYCFAIQIYCDFSGYTDIARGVARLMGFQLMRNFNLPYLATNPSEFWRRWHISLSSWLRDYLYIPLGGNRSRRHRVFVNLMITMLLGGLWHGAAWNFVLWGCFQGLLLCFYRWWSSGRLKPDSPIPAWRRVGLALIYFQITCFGWLLFRAESLQSIIDMSGQLIFTWTQWPFEATAILLPLVFFAGLLLLLELYTRSADDPRTRPGWNSLVGPLIASLMILCIIWLTPPSGQDFIYFQF